MKDQIDRATHIMLDYYGDSAAKEFYRLLKAREFRTTRCPVCEETSFPPRPFCPRCFSRKVVWVDLPREGTLYAFTQQDRSLRFPNPDVIGLVELEGIGLVLSHVRAPFAALSIGRRLRLAFLDISDDLTLHVFEPI